MHLEYNDELITKYLKTKTTEDRDAVILEYTKLAYLIAGQLYKKNARWELELGDYEGYAMLGLIEAVSKYNEDVGVKFETYASHRIRGAVLDELRRFDTITRSVRDNQKLYRRYQDIATEKYGANYTRDQLKEVNNITETELLKLEQDMAIQEATSFEGLAGTDEDSFAYDPKDETHLGDGEYWILQDDLVKCLQKAVSELTDVERKVINMLYFKDMRPSEIAEVLGVIISRISQVHAKALKKMGESNELVDWVEIVKNNSNTKRNTK